MDSFDSFSFPPFSFPKKDTWALLPQPRRAGEGAAAGLDVDPAAPGRAALADAAGRG